MTITPASSLGRFTETTRFDNPANWNQYCAERLQPDDTLNLALLGLGTKIATTNASNRLPVYIQGHRLGQGGFAQVYKAIEKYTGDVYAMKLYDKSQKARWQEPEMLERLKHQHIVQYVAYIRMADRPAQLIMEYIEGPNLQEYLDPRNGYPPLGKAGAREVLHQLLLAVAYLHGEKVTHRDIKPANIILACCNPILTKLVDFGLATGTETFDTHCGTPLYLAPELVKRRGRWTNKVDIFAVGVIALALFGVSFTLGRARGPQAYLDAVLQQKKLLAAESQPLPAHFDFVVQLLSEDPGERPSAEDCLGHAFFRSTAHLGSSPGRGQGVLNPDVCTQIFDPDQHWEVTEIVETQDKDAAEQAHDGDEWPQQLINITVETEQRSQMTPDRTNRRRSSRREMDRPHRSRQPASSSSVRHKRQKQHHSGSGSGRSAFVRSGAPSPRSGHRDRSSHASVPDGQDDQGEEVDRPHSADRLPEIDEHAASCVSTIPDTASWGSIPEQQWAFASSQHDAQQDRRSSTGAEQAASGVYNASLDKPATSELTNDESGSEADLYDGCWFDPLHALGAGSSLEAHRHVANTAREAVSHPALTKPALHKTPSFRSFSGLEASREENVPCSVADGAGYGGRITDSTEVPSRSPDRPNLEFSSYSFRSLSGNTRKGKEKETNSAATTLAEIAGEPGKEHEEEEVEEDDDDDDDDDASDASDASDEEDGAREEGGLGAKREGPRDRPRSVVTR
ncbi:Protein kinase-like domain protein [Niveomyces insectorum RCEF 264]|uniref:Protein kinase-like domain protein n=1 Tax=Niveomyces insectorum RCEF 264 TaxID=1081102 RepID=A0A168A5J3_9HYPO|nr:Protein kinase-like domain protein [Niveomyces insectorum RCEF 264]